MNILSALPQLPLLLASYLVARVFARAASGFSQPAGYILAFASGFLLSFLQGEADILGLPLVQTVFNVSAGLLLYSGAHVAFSNPASGSYLPWKMSDLPQRGVLLALPATGLLAAMVGSLLLPHIFPSDTIRLGLVLSIALWLSHTGNLEDLVAAVLVWMLLDFINKGNDFALYSLVLPFLILVASGGCIFFLSHISADKKESLRGNLIKDALLVLSALAAISFSLAGFSWGLAALATGMLTGYAAQIGYRTKNDTLAHSLAFESGLFCSFAAGLGLNFTNSTAYPAGTLLFAGAVLVISALRGLLYGKIIGAGSIKRHLAQLLPDNAAPFALILYSGLEVDISQSLTFGLAIAGLAALPLAGKSREGVARKGQNERSWKPLVAVSRRGNVAGILAFAHALAESDQPIRSVCVAAATGSQGPDASEAEETLVRAVAIGASNGYHIVPSVITAASTADGLARAALERKADCILVGWNENPMPSSPGSKSIIEALILATPANVISLRKPEIFSKSKRLVFITMAGSMDEPGYKEAAAIAVTAWGRKPSAMESLVIGDRVDDLATALNLDDNQLTALPVWRDIPEVVRRRGSQSLAFFVAAARPDWPGWNPGAQRIPSILQDSFPDAALAVFYLKAPLMGSDSPEDQTRSEFSRATETSDRERIWPPLIQSAIQAGRILTEMKEAVLIDAITVLAKTIFPQDKLTANRMATEFSTTARTEPIELAPGILLLHAHAKGSVVPALSVGVNRAGWRLVALEEPVRIIVMLVSPIEAGPAAHLEALTQIAKAIRDYGFSQAILNPDQAQAFLPG